MRSDLIRCFQSKKMVASIAGIVMILWFGNLDINEDTAFSTYRILITGVPALLGFIVAAIPYAGAISEDFENRYIYYVAARENMKKYVISKSIVVLISSMGTIMVGHLIFVFLFSVKNAVIDLDDLQNVGRYGGLLLEKHYVMYFFLVALQMALLAGILSIFAMYLSLWISNHLFVISSPFMIMSILTNLGSTQNAYMNVCSIYTSVGYEFDGGMPALVWGSILSICVCIGLMILTYHKLERRIQYE